MVICFFKGANILNDTVDVLLDEIIKEEAKSRLSYVDTNAPMEGIAITSNEENPSELHNGKQLFK